MSTQALQVHLDIERRGDALYAHLRFENREGVPLTVPKYVFDVYGTAYFQICPGGGTVPCDDRGAIKYTGPLAKVDTSKMRVLAPAEKVEATVRIDHVYDFSKVSGEFRVRYRWGCFVTIGSTEQDVDLVSNQVVFRK